MSDSDPSAKSQAYDWWFDTINDLVKQRSADNSSWETIAPLLGQLLALANIVGSDVSTPLNVIAYGSNSNGSWVRFAGGLQVCWQLGGTMSYNSTSLLTGTVTFPAAFSSAPLPLIGVIGSASSLTLTQKIGVVSYGSPTETGMQARAFSITGQSFASGDMVNFNYFVIGMGA